MTGLLSYSQVSRFARCRLEWWFYQVVRLRPVERTDPRRLLGNGFHKAVEYRNTDRRGWYDADGHEGLDPYFTEDVIEVGARYVEQHATAQVIADWEAEWGQFDPRRSLGVMLEMLDLAFQDPSSTEGRMREALTEWRIETAGMTGIVDLVYRIDGGGPLVVRDWKTTSRLDAANAVQSPQLMWYGWLMGQDDPGTEDREDHLPLGEHPLWLEVVAVSNVPASTPKLTKPTAKNPAGRLAAVPNRYTPDVYLTWCEEVGIAPETKELDRLRSPSHVAGFVQVARKMVTPPGLAAVERWIRFWGEEMRRQGASRPEGVRDPRVCFGAGGGRPCDFAQVCLDYQDTGALRPAEEYGMEIGG